MENLKAILMQEIKQFREIGHSFINKEISIAEFKAKSGGMGMYAQRGGQKFMLRFRIPAGVFDLQLMKLLSGYIDKYGVEKLHLTTRQAVQFHDLDFDNVCDMMEDSLNNGLVNRGGGGNFPRNVALSPLSGVDKDEAFDVTPYAILVNDYFIRRMNTYKLPRKLKVAFSNNNTDTANATLTDLGFVAVNENGNKMFKMYIAGGLGKDPAVGVAYDKLVKAEDVLYYVEAMVRLFVDEGNYENKHQARTRYIADRMGAKQLISCFDKHLEAAKEMELPCVKENPYEVTAKGNGSTAVESLNVIAQKQSGLYTVVVQPVAGQLSANGFKNIVSFVERYPQIQVRLTAEEGMYVRNLNGDMVNELLEIAKDEITTTTLAQSLSCIGVPTCQMGIEQSQKMLSAILSYFKENNLPAEIMPRVQISGCGNSCSRHQVAEIGLAGIKKRVDDKVQDAFVLFLNGKRAVDKTVLGDEIGVVLFDDIPVMLGEIAKLMQAESKSFVSLYDENKITEITEKYVIK